MSNRWCLREMEPWVCVHVCIPTALVSLRIYPFALDLSVPISSLGHDTRSRATSFPERQTTHYICHILCFTVSMCPLHTIHSHLVKHFRYYDFSFTCFEIYYCHKIHSSSKLAYKIESFIFNKCHAKTVLYIVYSRNCLSTTMHLVLRMHSARCSRINKMCLTRYINKILKFV